MTTNPPTNLAWRTQFAIDFEGEINVDLFAGGGDIPGLHRAWQAAKRREQSDGGNQ